MIYVSISQQNAAECFFFSYEVTDILRMDIKKKKIFLVFGAGYC